MRHKLAVTAAGLVFVTTMAGCAAGSTPAATDDGPLEVSFLTGSAEGTGSAYTMQKLVDDYGNDTTLTMDYLGADMDQKIQLLASQDQLPTFFQVGTPSQIEDLYDAGKIADLEPVLEELGVLDDISPLSVDIIKGLYGGHLLGLPLEVSVEGFWYNKKLLADNDIEPPTTWDELDAASAKLKDAGIQPLATAGKAGWPVTRLIGSYIERSVGPDALQSVADGDAKFTDPDYVEGAATIAEFSQKGYFGEAPAALDYAAAEGLFLQGDAAMWYGLTGALADFANPDLNAIGEDNIGWFPIPEVEGGAGSIDQAPANVGLPMAVTNKTLTPQAKDFLKYLVENYGSVAMSDLDLITGFATDETSDSPLVADQAEVIGGLKEAMPWFEALQGPKGTQASQDGATALIGGGLSPEEFMQQVQAAQ